MTDIAIARLRELLSYEPETGALTWRVDCGRGRRGESAGTLRSDGYLRIQIEGCRKYASHFAWALMTGAFPDAEIDHEDRDKANNAWRNLRPATKSQNCANRVARVGDHGFRGVTRCGAKFKAQLNSLGRHQYLGVFDTAAAAHAAWTEAAETTHGDFKFKEAA